MPLWVHSLPFFTLICAPGSWPLDYFKRFSFVASSWAWPTESTSRTEEKREVHKGIHSLGPTMWSYWAGESLDEVRCSFKMALFFGFQLPLLLLTPSNLQVVTIPKGYCMNPCVFPSVDLHLCKQSLYYFSSVWMCHLFSAKIVTDKMIKLAKLSNEVEGKRN